MLAQCIFLREIPLEIHPQSIRTTMECHISLMLTNLTCVFPSSFHHPQISSAETSIKGEKQSDKISLGMFIDITKDVVK